MSKVFVSIKANGEVTQRYGGNFLKPSTEHAAGLDIRADASGTIQPGEALLVGTGVFMEIQDTRYCALLLPRSGLGMKGITLANSPGLIDADYRGEVKLAMRNESGEPFNFTAGDRLAQMVFVQFASPIVTVIPELSQTARGEGGFGSTGT